MLVPLNSFENDVWRESKKIMSVTTVCRHFFHLLVESMLNASLGKVNGDCLNEFWQF